MSKISKPQREPKLPEDQEPRPVPRRIDLNAVGRAVCVQILSDPVSSATDKLRALEVLSRFPPRELTVNELVNAEIAGLSDAELDAELGLLTQPLHDRDPREIERELERRTAKLEAEFEQRVVARVRELVDVEAVQAKIEQRARQITSQGGPLAHAPAQPAKPEVAREQPSRHGVWPPDRHRNRRGNNLA